MSSSLAVLPFLMAAGFTAGFVDAVAGGGGLLTVPALLATGLPVPVVLGTNKAHAVWGAGTSVLTYARSGKLERGFVRTGFVFGALGSFLGAFCMLMVDPTALRPVVLGLLMLAVVLTLAPRPRSQESMLPPARAALALVALLLGAYDGFFGPGTGTLLIVAFMWIFGRSALVATANAKVVNFASNLAAFGLCAWRGVVLWELALPMGAANVLGAWLGSKVALRRGSGFVRAVAVCIALALSARVAWQIWLDGA